MRNLLLTSLAAISLSMPASPAAAAGDPYVGEYVGDCPNAQCFIEITKIKKKGKAYNLRFTAADPMDATKVLCQADIPMKRGKLVFTAYEQYEDALSGEYKGDPLVWLLALIGGSIQFYIEDAPCGRFDMSGEYGPYGD
ncbi:hypothetical protein [Brucella pituitosa]